jgi:hypothetical protein
MGMVVMSKRELNASASSNLGIAASILEMVQIDGSDHRWFEDRAAACTLLVFIDDATSRLMELRFVVSESTFAYFEALKSYLRCHRKPAAFYSDKHSIFGCRTRTRSAVTE